MSGSPGQHGAGTCTAPGQGEPGVFRWPGQWAGQGRTFTVHAVAPRTSRHGQLVLVAAGLTAFPTDPRRARAAARVQVTVALLALAALGGRGGRGGMSSWLRTLGVLATPRCPACSHSRLQPCSGSPQWPGAHSRHWGPPVPGRQWHCPLWGWHSELSAAGPQAHGRQPSQPSKPKCPSWGHRLQSTALSSPQNPPSFSPGAMRSRPHRAPPLPPGPAPIALSPTHKPHPSYRAPPLHQGPAPPRKCYLTAVTAQPSHTGLAQAVSTVGVTGLRPAWGAVTPCRKSPWEITPASSQPSEALTSLLLHMHLLPAPNEAPRCLLFTTSLLHPGPDHTAARSLSHCAQLRCSPGSAPTLKRGQSLQTTPGPARGCLTVSSGGLVRSTPSMLGSAQDTACSGGTPLVPALPAYGCSCRATGHCRRSQGRSSRSGAQWCGAGSRGRRLSGGRSR